MSTEDDNIGGGGAGKDPQRRDRTESAAKAEALRNAFGSTDRSGRAGGAQAARGRARAARKAAGGPTAVNEVHGGDETLAGDSYADDTTRSDRLVSEAVMAGLDAMSGASTRVPVGAGGGGLPPRPEDERATVHPTERTTPVPATVPGGDEGNDEADLASLARARGARDHPLVGFGHLMDSFVSECGEMAILGGQVFKSAIMHPKGYWGDVKDQIYDALKLCWVPMVFAVTGFGFGAPGLQGGNILTLFGVPDRIGGFMMFATIREFGPFVEAMVVAGVVGTAITADLGARRIREEIDAMEVLGVDPIRKLIVPRVISVTIMTALFDLFALFLGIVGGFAAAVFLTSSPSGYVASFYSESNISDDWGSVLKTAIFGVIIGLVCCYKGFRAKGGPAGVGKAVNQAVVISFALIWVVDYTFTNLLLGYAPSTQVIK
jgi:phospholipid/cholesterol/gamma-HCH transport system permease protein